MKCTVIQFFFHLVGYNLSLCFVNNGTSEELLFLFVVVAQVVANLETPETETKELEKGISTRTNSLLYNKSSPEMVEPISELKSHRLIGAKSGHSVALYFNCESSKELNDLWTLMESGRLKNVVEKYFNRLQLTEHHIKIRLKWSAEDRAVQQSILDEGLLST